MHYIVVLQESRELQVLQEIIQLNKTFRTLYISINPNPIHPIKAVELKLSLRPTTVGPPLFSQTLRIRPVVPIV